MPAPILWGILALGALALSCNREEEPQPPEKKPPPPPPCPGDSYVLNFGAARATLCHEEREKDGLFQPAQDHLQVEYAGTKFSHRDQEAFEKYRLKFGIPDPAGLHLGRWIQAREWTFPSEDRWSLEAEKLLSNAIEFCRERGLDLDKVRSLASRIQPPLSQQVSSSKEKAYALMVAAIFLSIRQNPENPFYASRREFVDTAIEKINAGKLRLQDIAKDGQKADFFSRAFYSLSDNTVMVGETALDLRNVQDRAGFVHELFHFFQDASRKENSLANAELEAYFVEAEYALHEKGFLDGKTPPEKVEAYIAAEITDRKDASHPLLAVVRAVYFRSRGDRVAYEKWLNQSREGMDVTKVLEGIFHIMGGPLGPGKPGSAIKRFLDSNPGIDDLSAKDAVPIWRAEIEKLKAEKKLEIARLKALLSGPKPEQETLLRQYFQVLKTTMNATLLERIWVLRSRQSGSSAPVRSQENLKDKMYLTAVARELAPLRVSRILISPVDGVD